MCVPHHVEDHHALEELAHINLSTQSVAHTVRAGTCVSRMQAAVHLPLFKNLERKPMLNTPDTQTETPSRPQNRTPGKNWIIQDHLGPRPTPLTRKHPRPSKKLRYLVQSHGGESIILVSEATIMLDGCLPLSIVPDMMTGIVHLVLLKTRPDGRLGEDVVECRASLTEEEGMLLDEGYVGRRQGTSVVE